MHAIHHVKLFLDRCDAQQSVPVSFHGKAKMLPLPTLANVMLGTMQKL
jgi:hypothetical protein